MFAFSEPTGHRVESNAQLIVIQNEAESIVDAVARLQDDKTLFEEIFGKVKVLLKDLPIDSLIDEDNEDEEKLLMTAVCAWCTIS